jgi:hypothetical protein
MKKWALIGGGLLLLAWSPWLYAELTSAPAEKKVRDLASDEPSAEAPVVVPAAEPSKPEPEPDPEPEPAVQPDPAAVPADKVAAAAQANDKAAEPGVEPAAPEQLDEQTDEVAAGEQEDVPPPVAEGPTEVLKHAFDTQPRDALWAKDAEARIAGMFGTTDVPAEMLQTATCRKAVCRVEVRWTRDRAPAFVSVFQAAKQGFGSAVGILPVGTLDEDGHQQVDLYLARKGYTVADLVQ